MIAVEDSKKIVRRLKEIFVAILLILLSVFCVILSIRIEKLEHRLDAMKAESNKTLEIVWDEREVLTEEMGQEEDMSSEAEVLIEEEQELKKVYLNYF